jgi:fatty acid desaturase
MAQDLGTLREELRAAGMFSRHEARSWLEIGAMAAAVAACLVGIATFGWIAAIFLVPPAAILSTSIAMEGHEGSHRSFSDSPLRNTIVAYLVFPLFAGLSPLYWRYKHDRMHHGHPNVEGVDPDIAPFPFVSSQRDHARSGPKARWFQRHMQKWLFWPMSTLMTIGMRRSSMLYLLRYPNKREPAWSLDVACIVVHYVAWLVVPAFVWGLFPVLAVYAALWGLVGVCLALVFAPAHMGMPIVADQHHDWVHQLETTRNLEMPRIVSFFFMGLDYQVEHHLFPKIPRHKLPEAARITRAWCERNGIVYQSMPYGAALVDAARFMSDAWSREAVGQLARQSG